MTTMHPIDLADFELSPAVEREQRAFAALTMRELGASDQEVQQLYGLTPEELRQYEKLWMDLHASNRA